MEFSVGSLYNTLTNQAVYESYVKNYYGVSEYSGTGGWFSVQLNFSEEKSTSMIDVAALFLEKQIIIKYSSSDEVMYTSDRHFNEKIEVQYGSDHFTAISNFSNETTMTMGLG